MNGAVSFVPGEAHASLVCTPRKQWQPLQRAPGQSPAIADEPSLPGGSAEWDPAASAACALPRGVGPAVKALSLLLIGAALFFSAMLCLWRERSRHQLCRERLCTQLPPALRRGWRMCHPVLWAAQVRAVSSSQAREEPAATAASSLPEPGPGAPACCSALLAVLLTVPITCVFPQVLLLRAPPATGSGGSSIPRHRLRHLPGAPGGQHVLPDPEVPSVQAHLVPPPLHPGRSPPLTLRPRPALSSTRPHSRSRCFCFSCRGRP